MSLLLFLSLSLSSGHAGWFKNFCARHLIADDPYQLDLLSIDELVDYYFKIGPSQDLRDEMLRRTLGPLSSEDLKILTKILEEGR